MNMTLRKCRQPRQYCKTTFCVCILVIWLLALLFQGILPARGLAADRDESTQEQAGQESLDSATKLKVAVLWVRAKGLTRKKDWKKLATTLDEILELDPHDIEAYRHAAWNLTYNLSIEPEAAAEQYEWVRKGILKLIEGIELNEHDIRLWRDAGWFIGNKIGRSSEHQEYRQLFADDKNFHEQIAKHIPLNKAQGPNGKPDSWLVAHLMALHAVELFDSGKSSKKGCNPLILLSEPGMYQRQYARTLNEEGHFDQAAIEAWRAAEQEWRQFGDRELPTDGSTSIKLNDQTRLAAKVKDLWTQFDRLQPGLRDRLKKKILEAIPESARQAYETPIDKRTEEQKDIALTIEHALELSFKKLSQKAEGSNRDEALSIARQALDTERLIRRIKSYAGIVNYSYWLQRCHTEQADTMVEARRLLYQVNQQLAKNNIDNNGPANPGVRTLYEQAFTKWALALKIFPHLLDDPSILDDLEGPIERYRKNVLRGEPLPDDFPLRPLLEILEKRNEKRTSNSSETFLN